MMNKLDFLIMQVKAEQSFRAIMERFNNNFEVKNANPTNLPADNGAGQRDNAPQPNDIPGGNVYPSPSA